MWLLRRKHLDIMTWLCQISLNRYDIYKKLLFDPIKSTKYLPVKFFLLLLFRKYLVQKISMQLIVCRCHYISNNNYKWFKEFLLNMLHGILFASAACIYPTLVIGHLHFHPVLVSSVCPPALHLVRLCCSLFRDFSRPTVLRYLATWSTQR